MNNQAVSDSTRQRVRPDIAISLSLTAALLFFIIAGVISYWNTRVLSRDAQLVVETHKVITNMDELLSLVKDAETGQRGYIITGTEKYLEPYTAALTHLDEKVSDIERLTKDDAEQQTHIPLIRNFIAAKLKELDQTIVLRRSEGFDAARAVVITDHGKSSMDGLRGQIAFMQQEEIDIRVRRLAEMEQAYHTAIISGILTAALGLFLTVVVGALIRRTANMRMRQQWLQNGEVGMSKALLGELRMEQLAESVLKFLCEYLDAHAAVFFNKEGNHFRRLATYGVRSAEKIPEQFQAGESLLGQAAKDNRTLMVDDVPEGYLSIGSALGESVPRHLLIMPANADGSVNAVIEFGFVHPLNAAALELLDKMSALVGIAVRSANYRAHLQNLLEETQRQTEELQVQSEELRVANEELEEQSRALKASQTNLEQQQAELEQTNSQLEEQTQLLETQRDDVARSKEIVQQKARELEQASRYKSDFLANMSHELRTPLNASLILAKLLADNPSENLTAEQVKYAKTIQSSGNDLLALINDILDLSKIEAGHMEMRSEQVQVKYLVKDILQTFEPLAREKGLELQTEVAPGCPANIQTDSQRLKQILKNLLSNALKFTQQGSVKLTVHQGAAGQIAFSVSDTGIGIAKEQQEAVFDAFRQADGTISRKYGGTGLGLSISRELTRLLGGTLQLASEPGKGSVFTIVLPETYDATLIKPQSTPIPTSQPGAYASETPIPATRSANVYRQVEDDRDRLTNTSRILLVVEDDESFARILYDLAHELDFQCLIAMSAEDALVMARQYLPSAVLLDVGVPDHSGLSVLDRLKRDSRTRHIPVHVVSANDYSQKALSLGAVGYMMKPVKREDISDALKRLETKLAQRMRRVLIVEDDEVQRNMVLKLLGSRDVETVAVGTAAECLARLKEATFDCMVLDLSLPDASGYSLLETLSNEDTYSFPPVIVYTARDLTMKEEQRLRRYSKSIIIKGAKSPERLFDEVSLFLHQVVSDLSPEQQRMLEKAKNRDAVLEGRRILVVEDDVRNIYALTNILEPQGAIVEIARNGQEALDILEKNTGKGEHSIELVLMDVMMPEMDGLTATREIRKKPEWKKLPVIMLTAKAMKDDQERCLEAGANDYMAKPLDVEKLLSLVRVWMPR